MAKSSVTMPWTYTARVGGNDVVELILERERINFVEEIIPDGQLAGMIGHRQVPGVDTMTFELTEQEARALIAELQAVVGEIGTAS